MRKYEVGTEEKIVELYPDGYNTHWHNLIGHDDVTVEQWSHYVAKLKDHEEKRLSTNKRNAYWRKYNEDK